MEKTPQSDAGKQSGRDEGDAIAAPDELSAIALGVKRKNLDNALVSGVAWIAVVKWISQILTWGTTLIVARLLQPSDYGLIGMAAIFLGLVQLVSQFGLGTAVITMHDLDDDQVSQLNTVSLLLGIVGFVLSAAVAIPIGKFFRASKLPLVIIVMSIAFVISAFSLVPNALLQKEMRFKVLAIIQGFQGLAQAISTLILAYLGFGYWALICGNLTLSFVATILTLIWKRQRFAWPQLLKIRRVLVYSWHIFAARLSWFIYSTGDFITAGRVLGEAPLGNYNLAWTLAYAPLEKITTLVNQVTPSIFAAVKTDYAALRRYLRNITGALSLVVFPSVFGITLVANEFVHVALGQKWVGVVLPLEFLTIHALFQSNAVLLTPLLNVIGEERFGMWNSMIVMAILLPSFYIGSRWGAGGIASVWVFVYPIAIFPLFWRLFRKIKMSVREYMRALWPALNGCIFMAVAVETFKLARPPEWPLYLDLALEVFIGAGVYVLCLLLMHRNRLRALVGLIKNLQGQGI